MRKVCALFSSGNGLINFFLVVFFTSNGMFRTKIREWFLAFLQLFVGLQSFWQYKIFERLLQDNGLFRE
jgi:hypothetical protein